jgi:hypothetical protein
MTINGESAEATIIERDSGSPSFGILHVATNGRLTMTGITIRGGLFSAQVVCLGNGAGISNEGLLAINDGIIERNFRSRGFGGGIYNLGTVTRGHLMPTSETALRKLDLTPEQRREVESDIWRLKKEKECSDTCWHGTGLFQRVSFFSLRSFRA